MFYTYGLQYFVTQCPHCGWQKVKPFCYSPWCEVVRCEICTHRYVNTFKTEAKCELCSSKVDCLVDGMSEVVERSPAYTTSSTSTTYVYYDGATTSSSDVYYFYDTDST